MKMCNIYYINSQQIPPPLDPSIIILRVRDHIMQSFIFPESQPVFAEHDSIPPQKRNIYYMFKGFQPLDVSSQAQCLLWRHKQDVTIYDVTRRRHYEHAVTSHFLWRHKRSSYALVYILSIK